MKKKILVLGGTRFFGVHLVNALLREGHEVIVATRGNVQASFIKDVQGVVADRKNLEDLKRISELGPFDLIYDQVCMSAQDAHYSTIAFNGKCKRYIFTSTGSVYNSTNGIDLFEDLYDPKTYKINLEDTNPYNYQEAKRQAEAVFYQMAPFEAVMVRFPIVLGVDDYSLRLKFHVDRIKNGEEIYFPNLDTKMGFIQSHEAGKFLNYIGKHNFTGPVNSVSSGYVALRDLVAMIEMKANKKVVLAKEASDTNHSPFGFSSDFMMPNKLAQSLGFSFDHLNDYLPKLVDFYLAK